MEIWKKNGKGPVLPKKGGGRDLMMTYKPLSLGKWLGAGMGVLRSPGKARRWDPSAQGKTVLILPKMGSFGGYWFPHM